MKILFDNDYWPRGTFVYKKIKDCNTLVCWWSADGLWRQMNSSLTMYEDIKAPEVNSVLFEVLFG